jgi:hypothetical protein
LPNRFGNGEEADLELSLFPVLFDYLTHAFRADREISFALGWMAWQFPWCCGDASRDWEALGAGLWESSWLSADGLNVDAFECRGEYGHYFAHIFNQHRTELSQEP